LDIVAARITVRGRVQGVGYRWFVRRAAEDLSRPGHVLSGEVPTCGALPGEVPTDPPLTGWVANRRDGSVELEVAGDPARVAQLLERLRQGPPASSVSAVDVQWLPAPAGVPTASDGSPAHAPRFEIRPTS